MGKTVHLKDGTNTTSFVGLGHIDQFSLVLKYLKDL